MVPAASGLTEHREMPGCPLTRGGVEEAARRSDQASRPAGSPTVVPPGAVAADCPRLTAHVHGRLFPKSSPKMGRESGALM
jgi:hypothetical protein